MKNPLQSLMGDWLVWQRTSIVMDAGADSVKTRFGERIIVAVPSDESFSAGLITTLPKFQLVWDQLWQKASEAGWQPTAGDRVVGPFITVVLRNNHPPLEKQLWEQFAAQNQLALSTISASKIQQKAIKKASFRAAYVLGLHLGHQKTELVLVHHGEVLAQTTLWWGAEVLQTAGADRQRRIVDRWGWELHNWLSLETKLPANTAFTIALSGGGAELPGITETFSTILGVKTVILPEPTLLLVDPM